jgi:hypothetical protein
MTNKSHSLASLIDESICIRTERTNKCLQNILAFLVIVEELLTDCSRLYLDLRLNMRLFALMVNKLADFERIFERFERSKESFEICFRSS